MLATISDRRIAVTTPANLVDHYEAKILSAADYDAFGAVVPGRFTEEVPYHYGFAGFERDDDIKGSGNSYYTEARLFDPRIARWLSPDPVEVASMSPYAAFSNNPLRYGDPRGQDSVDLVEEKRTKSTTGGKLPPSVPDRISRDAVDVRVEKLTAKGSDVPTREKSIDLFPKPDLTKPPNPPNLLKGAVAPGRAKGVSEAIADLSAQRHVLLTDNEEARVEEMYRYTSSHLTSGKLDFTLGKLQLPPLSQHLRPDELQALTGVILRWNLGNTLKSEFPTFGEKFTTATKMVEPSINLTIPGPTLTVDDAEAAARATARAAVRAVERINAWLDSK